MTSMIVSLSELQLADLQQNLEAQIALYDTIEKQMLAKQQVLIGGKADGLIDIDQRLLALGQQLSRLEQARLTFLKNAGCEGVRLHQLVSHCPPPKVVALQETCLRLTRQIQRVEMANRETASLLDLSIQWVEKTVGIIAKAMLPEATVYDNSGHATSRQGKNLLFYRTASTIERKA